MAAKKSARKSSSKKNLKKSSTKKVSSSVMDDLVMNDNAVEVSSTTSTIDTSKVKSLSTKSKVIAVVGFVVILAALYFGRTYLLAASVNGEVITRISVIGELEKRYGKASLESLVTEVLIAQEAKKNNITVSNEDVDNEMKKIEESVKAQGQDLDTLLTLQGLSREDLVKQIKNQKIIEKVLASKVEPTDQEVDEYITKNKDSFPKDQKPEDIKASVKEQLRQQKLSTEFQTWIDSVKKDAKIQYFTNY